MKNTVIALSLVVTLTTALGSCSGGTSGSAIQGSTTNIGLWVLNAIINVIIEGAATNINHTTVVDVQSNGLTLVRFTDSDCALSIFVNGNTMTYTQQCTILGATAPCILTLTSVARMSGANLSGSFGPETFVCVGSATSYAGNLTGRTVTQEEADVIAGGDTTPPPTEEPMTNGTGTETTPTETTN